MIHQKAVLCFFSGTGHLAVCSACTLKNILGLRSFSLNKTGGSGQFTIIITSQIGMLQDHNITGDRAEMSNEYKNIKTNHSEYQTRKRSLILISTLVNIQNIMSQPHASFHWVYRPSHQWWTYIRQAEVATIITWPFWVHFPNLLLRVHSAPYTVETSGKFCSPYF